MLHHYVFCNTFSTLTCVVQELWRQLVVVLCCVQFITIVLGVAVPIYQHKLRFCLRNLRLMHRAQDVDMTQSAISEQATLRKHSWDTESDVSL